ncbi:MAG: DegT/DnrJ/EryC1/StrS family aminotransferase [Acidobacteria bacterium]|nr:DegT/DnrJ/EryC1/StrS family aminotransferase [Acidobacteriota bacterium]
MPSAKSSSAVRVPLLDLAAQNGPLRDEILAAVARVADSNRFIMGPEVEGLERELAAMLGAKHAVGVSSGTDALLVAMMALGIGAGDEVITPTFSFFATAGCVSRLGATPKLVDIDPITFNVNVAAVERAITPRTKAIVPVHLYGLCADMEPLLVLARRRGIAIVEDAAQSIGSKYGDRQAGTMGAFGCFSFFPSKNLGAFGDAGLVTTNDEGLAARVKMLRNHGASERYFHKYIGGNFRLDALQAAVLRVKAPHLAGWTEFRRRNAARYDAMFRAARLDDVLALPYEPANRYHIFNQYVVRAPKRDALRAHLEAAGVATEIYYPVPFHLQECFADLGHRRGDFPEAESAAAEVLALPIYGELTEDQQAHVVQRIAEFYAA